jgi:hypothetical protein
MAIQFAPATDQESSFGDLEDGKYLFKTKTIEETPDNGYGEGFKWILNVASKGNDGKYHAILDDEGHPFELWHFTNKSKNGAPMGPRNRTRQLIEAILGRPMAEGESVSDDEILGKPFFGLVGPKVGQDGKSRQRILSVSPYTGGSTAAAAAPTPPPVADNAAADEVPF